MYKLLDLNLLATVPFEGDVLFSYVFLSLGLTLIGLFSKYKIFLLVATGPVLHLLYHMSDETHDGYQIMILGLASWIMFNTYYAFFGGLGNE